MAEVIHLDSCILRALVDPEEDRIGSSDAKHLLNSRNDVMFRVSILAIGEVFGKMAENRSAAACGEAAAELSRLFRKRKMELFGIGSHGEALESAIEIMNGDPMVNPTDALLVGCAIADTECGSLITLDQLLSESRVVEDVAKAHHVRILGAKEAISRRETTIERGANMNIKQLVCESSGVFQ